MLLKHDNNDEVEANITYNQVLDYIQQDGTQGLVDDDLFLFRAITAHEGPLTKEDTQYKGVATMLWLNQKQEKHTSYEP